jgi:hypothetical protein
VGVELTLEATGRGMHFINVTKTLLTEPGEKLTVKRDYWESRSHCRFG